MLGCGGSGGVRVRWRLGVGFLFVAGSGVLAPGGHAGQAQQTDSGGPSAALGDFSGTVAIGSGRKLYLECRGEGSPTVVLESGLRTRGDNWGRADLLAHGGAPVLPEVAKFARVCTYDRPGTTLNAGEVSRSDPAPMPRTALNVVRDLHALLRAARVPGPYVLVGHSMGGLFIRLYSAIYPEEVSGLVLVDALAEQIEPLFKPSDWTTFVGLNSGPLPGFENYAALETIDFDMSFQQMERELSNVSNEPMEKIPAAILVRGLTVEMPATAPPKFASVLEPAWRKSEEQLALAVPHIQYVIAKKSGHYIQLDEPAIVVQAIRNVVERAPHR
jgi:pimeloyl-ACP methyl ester carboxylesterase